MCPKGSGPHSAAKQRRSFRVPPINHPEACVPKAVEATFCSKTGPFFSCGSNKFCPNSIYSLAYSEAETDGPKPSPKPLLVVWRLAVVFAQRSSLDVSSECHDLHLASAAGPSSGPRPISRSPSFFVCACFKLDEYHLHYPVHILQFWKRLRT